MSELAVFGHDCHRPTVSGPRPFVSNRSAAGKSPLASPAMSMKVFGFIKKLIYPTANLLTKL